VTARVVPDGDAGRAEAIRVLQAGGIVALPTDTVYGLAADLRAPGAIGRLFAAKRRPDDRAVVLLLAEASQAGDLAAWPPTAEALAAAFWPGALTLILAQGPRTRLPSELTGGRETVGVRLPDHAAPRALAAALGPLAVSSANLSGLPEASDAAEIRTQLGESIDLILDGGPTGGGPPSTVVDCSGTGSRILREGAIRTESIAECLRAAGLPDPAS
jgi:L-threonylcarbamoyladenylate synthase